MSQILDNSLLCTFVAAVVLVVVGYASVYIALSRRGALTAFTWGATSYLSRCARDADPPVSAWVRWVALTADVALAVGFIVGAMIIVGSPPNKG